MHSKADQPANSGAFVQLLRPDKYRGQRVKLSGFVRAEGIEGWGGLWMRIDSADKVGVAYGNTKNREAKGTMDWAGCEIVLDVPQDAVVISLGGTLTGKGKLWVDDIALDVVGNDVATTGFPVRGQERKQPPPMNVPEVVRNLDFEK